MKEVKEKSTDAMAFFDLDGTLLPLPSLEYRLWRELRYRKKIGVRNYLNWLREAARLLPQGIAQIVNGNKAYLRGIRAEAQETLTLPKFFPEAVRRVRWHAERGDRIAIVSGTLEPLAQRATRLLEAELRRSGVVVEIKAIATQLESEDGIWTGRIVGEAMFGEAKARAIRRVCAARGIEPEKCFAYGDGMKDAAMLGAVGMPRAVNPTDDLARVAAQRKWPILRWNNCARLLHEERGRDGELIDRGKATNAEPETGAGT